jgi:predicted XRE-type DNA-binding protein
LLKAQLTLQIDKIVTARKLTQAQAQTGQMLGIKWPHVSALLRNRARKFSVGRLMEFLTALGEDVRITVKPTREAGGDEGGGVRTELRGALARRNGPRRCAGGIRFYSALRA